MTNMTRRMIAVLFVGVLALSALPAFVAPVSAQNPLPVCEPTPTQATLKESSTPDLGKLTPWQPETARVEFLYESNSGWSLDPVHVTITATSEEDWVQVNPSTQTATLVPSPNEEEFSETVSMSVSVMLTNQAPMGASTEVTFTATASAGTCVLAPQDLDVGAPVSVGFFEQYNVRLDRTMIRAGQNAGIDIPMVITNFGNGDIEIVAEPHEDSSGDLRASRIPSLIVPSEISGGDTNRETFNVEVRTPFQNGYQNRFDEFVLVVGGTPVQDRSIELQEYAVSAQIQTQGVYVPGFDAAIALLAALGVAFVSWTRRR